MKIYFEHHLLAFDILTLDGSIPVNLNGVSSRYKGAYFFNVIMECYPICLSIYSFSSINDKLLLVISIIQIFRNIFMVDYWVV